MPFVQASELKQATAAQCRRLATEAAAAHAPLSNASTFATSAATQRTWLLKRFFLTYWRMPQVLHTLPAVDSLIACHLIQ